MPQLQYWSERATRYLNRLEARVLGGINNAVGALLDKDAAQRLNDRIRDLQAFRMPEPMEPFDA